MISLVLLASKDNRISQILGSVATDQGARDLRFEPHPASG